MVSLADLAAASHVEIILALGGRIVVSKEAYLEIDPLPAACRVRAMSRREVVGRRARKMRRAS